MAWWCIRSMGVPRRHVNHWKSTLGPYARLSAGTCDDTMRHLRGEPMYAQAASCGIGDEQHAMLVL